MYEHPDFEAAELWAPTTLGSYEDKTSVKYEAFSPSSPQSTSFFPALITEHPKTQFYRFKEVLILSYIINKYN